MVRNSIQTQYNLMQPNARYQRHRCKNTRRRIILMSLPLTRSHEHSFGTCECVQYSEVKVFESECHSVVSQTHRKLKRQWPVHRKSNLLCMFVCLCVSCVCVCRVCVCDRGHCVCVCVCVLFVCGLVAGQAI